VKIESAGFLRKANRSAMAAVVILVLIYTLGMYVNLFIEIPEDATAWQFAMKSIILLLHLSLGSLLIIHSTSLVAMSVKDKNSKWMIFSGVGLAGVLLSVATGSSFITHQTELSSLLMALGFGVSIIAYTFGIYRSSSTK